MITGIALLLILLNQKLQSLQNIFLVRPFLYTDDIWLFASEWDFTGVEV
jgi:hypothetical protein